MAVHSFTIVERFSAEPGDVLSLASDAARWQEWAPVLLRGLGRRHPGAVTVRALPGGGGELEWECSIRTSDRVIGTVVARGLAALVALLARRLVTEADRRITLTRRPSLPACLQRLGLQLVIRPVLTIAPFDRRWIRAMRAVATGASRATGSRRVARPADGASVPGLWIDGPADAPGLLVLHGGGYVAGSADTHATMATTLARLSGSTAYVPDYRLAPEHRYPAALDDAEVAFRHLAERVGGAARVAVAGDSAGGALALGLLDRLRRSGERPAALALVSPWVDLAGRTGPGRQAGAARWSGAFDPRTPPRLARACRDAYAGNVPVDDPGVSPARRPLDASAPPTAIVCGGDDFVVDDVRRFVEASRSRGATIDLRVWPGMIHCFPVVAGTPEGASALAVLAVHIGSAVGGASDPRRED
ncbi:alpha/beta hydrolase [Dietzia maris]|uniref:alpha/beta hydrolase n=1 Tax=Dietzia maris TaxID=37915 RepID=UPI00223A88DD|nr:alpha/beta hydrolase [Dietzia maris]MCT1432746.1 alpha/beta hydrolase [Dietzia maris]MCT1521033.1 alpha/beta hydrolase [Dietzia maris]